MGKALNYLERKLLLVTFRKHESYVVVYKVYVVPLHSIVIYVAFLI